LNYVGKAHRRRNYANFAITIDANGAEAGHDQADDPVHRNVAATTNGLAAEYQSRNIGYEESQYSMLKRLELKREYHKLLKELSSKNEIISISTREPSLEDIVLKLIE